MTADESGKLIIDYPKLLNYMEQTGRIDEEWDTMKDWLDLLNEIGMIKLENVPDVEGGWQDFEDATEGMRSATEQSLDDVTKIRADLEEAAELAAESTPEALGLPVNTVGLEDVTEQVATMNNFINDMRLAGNDEGADKMLASLSAAAEMAGGTLEIVDGKITAIKDAAGKDADWDFLSKLINTTGLAGAAQTENGMVISGLGDMDYTITYTVDPDGSAALKITQLLKDSDQVAQERTINYDASGQITNIDTIEEVANTAGRQRVIGYYANGTLENAAAIEEAAGKPQRIRYITYTTNGDVANIEAVDRIAEGVARKRDVKYGAEGEVTEF